MASSSVPAAAFVHGPVTVIPIFDSRRPLSLVLAVTWFLGKTVSARLRYAPRWCRAAASFNSRKATGGPNATGFEIGSASGRAVVPGGLATLADGVANDRRHERQHRLREGRIGSGLLAAGSSRDTTRMSS